MPNKSDHYFNVNQREQLDLAIAAASLHAPWAVPMFRAVRDGLINLAQPQRDALITEAMLAQSSRPLIVLVSDDDYESTGPQGWACTQTLQSWGRGAIVHGAAGEAAHYELAVTGALAVRRFVIIECNSAHQKSWEAEIATRMSTLSIRAREGLHPKPLAPGVVN